MLCSWRTSDLALLLLLTAFLVAERESSEVECSVTQSNPLMQQESEDNFTLDSRSSWTDGKQMSQKNSLPLAEVNTSLSVQMSTKAVLCCPLLLLTNVLMTTWEIILRVNSSCKIAHQKETNETTPNNCTDRRITWASRPDQSPHLQIAPVDITHDGYYRCQMATTDGNFHRGYYLQVLVPPNVTLSLEKHRTAVCKAVAGKPAAWISWAPEGDCVTEKESYSNDTVTVRSTCHWSDSNVSTVTCLVSHLTDNRSLSIHLSSDDKSLGLYIQYIIPSITILIIMGSIWFLKISGCRKCKLKKDVTPVVDEDEMQPYATYTEKTNPFYDTVNKVTMPQVMQSEVDGTDLHAL